MAFQHLLACQQSRQSENCLQHPYNYSPSYTCDIRMCQSMPHLMCLMKHEFRWPPLYLLQVSRDYYKQRPSDVRIPDKDLGKSEKECKTQFKRDINN